MSLPTFHDTIRHIVRSMAFRDESEKRNALLAVDAHERTFGTSDTDAHVAELEAQAKAAARAANPDAPETAEEKAARLEAENTRLQALVAAAQTRPAMPGNTPQQTQSPLTA